MPVDTTAAFRTVDWALFAAVSLIWGSSFLLIAFALEGLTPATVTFGRVGLGAVTLWAIRAVRGARGGGSTVESIAPSDRGRLLLLSVLWVAVPFTLFPLAQRSINSALTGLLNGATPVFAAIVGTVLLRQAPRGAQLLGILLGLIGGFLISLPSLGARGSELRGVLLVLAATLCYGFALNLAAPLQARYGSLSLMSSMLALATLWVAPWALWTWTDNEWSVVPAVAVVALGAIGTGLAYLIMATLVGNVGPLRASFITYLIPVVALVLGVLVRDDTVAAIAVVGAAVVIGGALLAARRVS